MGRVLDWLTVGVIAAAGVTAYILADSALSCLLRGPLTPPMTDEEFLGLADAAKERRWYGEVTDAALAEALRRQREQDRERP